MQKKSELLEDIMEYFQKHYEIFIKKVEYEFQKDGNQMLVIKRKDLSMFLS